MALRRSLNLVVEIVQGGGDNTAVSFETFIECLRTDSLDRWAQEVRCMIADNRRTGVPAVAPHRDRDADRALQIEDQIRKLQAELRGLGRRA